MAKRHKKRCWMSLIIEKCKWKLQWGITSHQSEWPSSKKTKNKKLQINAGQYVERREPFFAVNGNVNWCSLYGEQYGCSLKTENRATIWSSNPTLGHISGENHGSNRCMHPSVHCSTAYSNQEWKQPKWRSREKWITVARTWRQPRCSSADKWIRKVWYIYTMEYYSAVKKNSFESVLMRWMKLEPMIQSEVSQKEKHRYSILTYVYGI